MLNKYKDYLKKYKNNYQEILNNQDRRMNYTSYGKESIMIFMMLIAYSFICIGSSVNSSYQILLYINSTIRLLAILLGALIVYIGLYSMILQRKLNNKYIFYFALVIGLFSTAYYIVVSYYTLLEVLSIF